jgi:hypothetical protein
MPVSWRLEDGVVFLDSDEGATYDEWKEAVEAALPVARTEHAYAVVHDLRRMARVPSLKEANARVQLLLRQSKMFGIRRWASIVSGPDNLGMGQTAEMLGAGESVEFRIFEDAAEAEAWARVGSQTDLP